MSTFSPTQFATVLDSSLPPAFGGKLCVAFSGGLDSTVLLHALASLRERRPDWSLRAVHVDHQLQAASASWAERCIAVAKRLGVALLVEKVTIARDHADGLEAAAREARYRVLRRLLEHGEVLLTAHHADDQLETVLLALMRGAGLQGLAAMPVCAPFACGWQVRPLLGFTRAQLTQWADASRIEAIDDPSNFDPRHDRNYLRHEVLPVLRRRWPAAASNAVRSTRHLADAMLLVDAQAVDDLSACAVGACLDVARLRVLDGVRRRNLIRYWLRLRGFDAPSTRKLAALEHDMFHAAADRNPVVSWSGVVVQRHRGLLYATPPQSVDAACQHAWDRREPLPLSCGALRFEAIEPSIAVRGFALSKLPTHVTVRYRSDGDSIRPAGGAHRRRLKKLLQEWDVLPWWRDRLPIICSGNEVIAIADLCIAHEFAAVPGEAAVRIVWDGKPGVLAEKNAARTRND